MRITYVLVNSNIDINSLQNISHAECKFSFADNEKQIAFATSTHALKKGQKVAHCESKWQKCTTPVTDCVLVRSRTMYDNGNWTILWPLQSQVDVEIERTTGNNDTLKVGLLS